MADTLVSEMKLRFRSDALRLRVNRREVEALAAGDVLEERVYFPGNQHLTYRLESSQNISPSAQLDGNIIRVLAPRSEVQQWARTDEIGMYFDLPAESRVLKVSIEKDLECVDGPEDERDPYAFERRSVRTC